MTEVNDAEDNPEKELANELVTEAETDFEDPEKDDEDEFGILVLDCDAVTLVEVVVEEARVEVVLDELLLDVKEGKNCCC